MGSTQKITEIETNKSYIYKKALSLFNIRLEKVDGIELDLVTIGMIGVYAIGVVTNDCHEMYLCNLWLDSAYSRVLEAFKWSFLTEPIYFEEIERSELETDYGFKFAYKIKTPYDEETEALKKRQLVEICNIYTANDKRRIVGFKKFNNVIYTNERDLNGSAIYKMDLEAYDKEWLQKTLSETKPKYYKYITLIDNGCPVEFLDLISYQLALLIAPSIAPKDLQIQQLIAQQYQMAYETLLKRECNQIKRFSNEEVE